MSASGHVGWERITFSNMMSSWVFRSFLACPTTSQKKSHCTWGRSGILPTEALTFFWQRIEATELRWFPHFHGKLPIHQFRHLDPSGLLGPIGFSWANEQWVIYNVLDRSRNHLLSRNPMGILTSPASLLGDTRSVCTCFEGLFCSTQ